MTNNDHSHPLSVFGTQNALVLTPAHLAVLEKVQRITNEYEEFQRLLKGFPEGPDQQDYCKKSLGYSQMSPLLGNRETNKQMRATVPELSQFNRCEKINMQQLWPQQPTPLNAPLIMINPTGVQSLDLNF